jgi:hypothetical protein
MDGDDGVGAIVFAAEHLLGLGSLDLLLELRESSREIRADVFAGIDPLDQDREVVTAPLQGAQERQVVFDAAPLLHHLLRRGLVAPEIGGGYLAFDVGELIVEAGCLKDASGVLWPAG